MLNRQTARILLLIGLFCVCTPRQGHGLDLSLQEDRLYLEARNTPLIDILEALAHYQVRVEADPTIDTRVTGRLDGEPIEQALDRLLQHHSHILYFKRVSGPLGDLENLSAIRVYDPNQPDLVQPIREDDGNLKVVTGADGKTEFIKDEILLGFKPGVSRDEAIHFLRGIGGTIISSIPELGIYQVRLKPGTNIEALAAQLKDHPLLADAEPNFAYRQPEGVQGEGGGSGTTRIPTKAAEGLPPVAILDSGLSPNAGLDNLVVGKLDALVPDRSLTDRSGHGTQMALLASGATTPDGISAPADQEGTPILAIRAFDDNGVASNFSIMRSIDFAIANGSKVMSMSWGSETSSGFLENAISYAQARGMLVVASAGNEPHGKSMYPAAYNDVIGVTAMNADGSRWEKSNFGSFADIAAPGHAQFPIGHDGPPGSYVGTSIGAPFVARQLNQYWARSPDANGTSIFTSFSSQLSDRGASGNDPYFGKGALDMQAIERLKSP